MMFLLGGLAGLVVGILIVVVISSVKEGAKPSQSDIDRLEHMRQRNTDYFNNPVVEYMKRHRRD